MKIKRLTTRICYIVATIFGVIGIFLAYLNNEVITGFFKGLIMEISCFVLMQLTLAVILWMFKCKIRSKIFENATLVGFLVYTIGTPIMFLSVYRDIMGVVFSIISCAITLIVPVWLYKAIIPKEDNKYASYVSDNLSYSYDEKDNKRNKANDFGVNTKKQYDSFGNYIGKVTTVRIGGIETRTYDDRDDKKIGEGTTFYIENKK